MHLEHLPSGRWRAAVRHNGMRRSVTAATRAEAQQAGAALLLELGGTPTTTVTVDELLVGHLATHSARLAPTTRADHHAVVKRLRADVPVFLDRRAADVTTVVVEHLYRQLAAVGWSAHRVGRLHDFLATAFRTAVVHGWCTHNPIRDVRRPRPSTAEIVPPDPADVRRLLDEAPPLFGLYLRMAAVLGARRGELVAIQWPDLDLDAGQVVIRRTVTYTVADGIQVGDGKTGRAGHRVLALGPTITGMLTDHEQAQAARAADRLMPAPVWVFSHDAGASPWRPDYATHLFVEHRRRLGLNHIRLNDLRHFAATELLAAGFTPVQTAHRLGHSSSTTTLRVYSHHIPATDHAAADLLDRLTGTG